MYYNGTKQMFLYSSKVVLVVVCLGQFEIVQEGGGRAQIMDGNRSQTQYDNAEIDKLIGQHGNNDRRMGARMGGRSMQIG